MINVRKIFKINLYVYAYQIIFERKQSPCNVQYIQQFSQILTELILSKHLIENTQKLPPRGIPTKRCSENMQHICRRTPMTKCDVKNTSGWLLMNIGKSGSFHPRTYKFFSISRERFRTKLNIQKFVKKEDVMQNLNIIFCHLGIRILLN